MKELINEADLQEVEWRHEKISLVVEDLPKVLLRSAVLGQLGDWNIYHLVFGGDLLLLVDLVLFVLHAECVKFE